MTQHMIIESLVTLTLTNVFMWHGEHDTFKITSTIDLSSFIS